MQPPPAAGPASPSQAAEQLRAAVADIRAAEALSEELLMWRSLPAAAVTDAKIELAEAAAQCAVQLRASGRAAPAVADVELVAARYAQWRAAVDGDAKAIAPAFRARAAVLLPSLEGDIRSLVEDLQIALELLGDEAKRQERRRGLRSTAPNAHPYSLAFCACIPAAFQPHSSRME